MESNGLDDIIYVFLQSKPIIGIINTDCANKDTTVTSISFAATRNLGAFSRPGIRCPDQQQHQ